MKRAFFYLFLAFSSFLLAQAPIQVPDCQEGLAMAPYYTYPYYDLIPEMEENNQETLKIFSYGSLMSPISAAETLSEESLATYKPAVAFGIKRVFSRDVPIKPDSKWGIPVDPNATGMLNVAIDEERITNGVVFDVQREDVDDILAREKGYDLLPVIVMDWDEAAKPKSVKCYIAYTFYAPSGTEYTSETIMPRPGYYELTRDAAKESGPLFSYLWFSSTYFADGKTPIIEWERDVQADDPSTQAKRDS